MEPIKISHKKLYPRISSVANTPGIYAWYYDFTRLIDILNISASKSVIIETFLTELENISKKIKLPSANGKIKGKLNTEYTCIIENIDYLKSASYHAKMNLIDFNMLKESIYVLQSFSAPLYIGKAVQQTLRQRYSQHIKNYNDAVSGKTDKNTFGHRLYEIGLNPSELIFKYHSLTNRDSEIDMIEHIINRITKPTLGER
jgi:hypothetical protein